MGGLPHSPPPVPRPLERTHPSAFRIVDEVRSIRFNQEQEEELLQKHLSLSLSMDSGSSLDIREVTFQQDLITALVTREKVQLPSPTQSVLTPPPSLPQPGLASAAFVKVSVNSEIWSDL